MKFWGLSGPEKMTGEKMNRDGSSWHRKKESSLFLKKYFVAPPNHQILYLNLPANANTVRLNRFVAYFCQP
jgi:hypothetical protein